MGWEALPSQALPGGCIPLCAGASRAAGSPWPAQPQRLGHKRCFPVPGRKQGWKTMQVGLGRKQIFRSHPAAQVLKEEAGVEPVTMAGSRAALSWCLCPSGFPLPDPALQQLPLGRDLLPALSPAPRDAPGKLAPSLRSRMGQGTGMGEPPSGKRGTDAEAPPSRAH